VAYISAADNGLLLDSRRQRGQLSVGVDISALRTGPLAASQLLNSQRWTPELRALDTYSGSIVSQVTLTVVRGSPLVDETGLPAAVEQTRLVARTV
jgi:hypothetical protein